MAFNKITEPFVSFGRSGLPILLAYVALIAWGWVSWQVVANAPSGKVTPSLTVKASDAPVVLGWRELGQRPGPRSAAARHLMVAKRGKIWFFGNRSQGKRVLVTTDRYAARFVQRWLLRTGDRISFDGADLTVTKLTGDVLTLRDRTSGREVTWDGEVEPKGEEVHKVCRGLLGRALDGARWFTRWWFSSDKPEIRLFSVGGGVNCSVRWKLVRLPPNAVWVVWQGGRFWLSPGALRENVLMFRKGEQRGRGFGDLVIPISGELGKVRSLILGMTRYEVKNAGDKLTFAPLSNTDFFYFDEQAPPNHSRVSWIAAGSDALAWMVKRNIWIVFGVLLGALAGVGIFLYWRKHYSDSPLWLFHAVGAIVPSTIGIWITLLLQQRTGTPDGGLAVAIAWLAWFWATFMLVWSGRMRAHGAWIWLFLIVIAAIGATTLFQLGAGADNTRWLGFYKKHFALLSLFAWGLAMLTIVPEAFWRRLWLNIFNRESLVAAVAVVLIGAMMLQFMLGSEEGIAGIQPVELVKTVFVILLGYVGLHITETRQREVKAYRRSPLKFLAPYFRFAGLFFLFIASMVMGVRDFSPMVIMSVVLLAWIWKVGTWQRDYSRASRIWKVIRPALAVFILVIVGVAYFVYNNPDAVPDGFPQKDRIQVWANPEIHPHSGSQVLGSMDLVGQSGWFGAKQWFGRNGPAMTLPAVQDDFITAFLINRFGSATGLGLLVVQLLFVMTLFALARKVERQFSEGDFREQNAGVVLGFTLFGLAWMHVAHWLISWGNTLGLLPVMGQPMTWLSAGNSHLMGFAMVIASVALVTSWISQYYDDDANVKPVST